MTEPEVGYCLNRYAGNKARGTNAEEMQRNMRRLAWSLRSSMKQVFYETNAAYLGFDEKKRVRFAYF